MVLGRHGFWAGRKSLICWVWEAPSAPKTIPEGGGRNPPSSEMIFGAAGAARTPCTGLRLGGADTEQTQIYEPAQLVRFVYGGDEAQLVRLFFGGDEAQLVRCFFGGGCMGYTLGTVKSILAQIRSIPVVMRSR